MKRISFIIIIIILAFIIIRLISSIYTLWHKQDLLTNAQLQLMQEQKKQVQLQKEFVKVKSSAFVDEEARNKLLLVKPGENQVLIDQSLLTASSGAKTKKAAEPFWQQWLDLFFNF